MSNGYRLSSVLRRGREFPGRRLLKPPLGVGGSAYGRDCPRGAADQGFLAPVSLISEVHVDLEARARRPALSLAAGLHEDDAGIRAFVEARDVQATAGGVAAVWDWTGLLPEEAGDGSSLGTPFRTTG